MLKSGFLRTHQGLYKVESNKRNLILKLEIDFIKMTEMF